MPPAPSREHAVELPAAPAAALRALAAAAQDWGADFAPHGDGGELRLPVVAGLRRGLLVGPLAIEPAGERTRVAFRPTSQDYVLDTSAVSLLVVAAGGALAAVAWPLFPRLLPVAALGMVLAASGWLLVASRQRGRGPAEFLASVAAHLEDAGAAGASVAAGAAGALPGDSLAGDGPEGDGPGGDRQ